VSNFECAPVVKNLAKKSDLVKEECKDVFHFQCLGLQCCNFLIEEMLQIEKFYPTVPLHAQTKNGELLSSTKIPTQSDGVSLERFGFKTAIKDLTSKIFAPIIQNIYNIPHYIFATHSLVVRYIAPNDTGHPLHQDNSGFTLNICLGHNFTGGELVFHEKNSEQIVVPRKPGYAVLHKGSHAHSANPIQSGDRYSLVIWFDILIEQFHMPKWAELPVDIRVLFLFQLDVFTLCQFSQTSTFYAEVCRKNDYWKPLFIKNFRNNDTEGVGNSISLLKKNSPNLEQHIDDWKQHYIAKSSSKTQPRIFLKMPVNAVRERQVYSKFETILSADVQNFIQYKEVKWV